MGYPLPIIDNRQEFPDDPDMHKFELTAMDYTLGAALNVNGNYEAEKLVAERLHANFSGIEEKVEFDSEYGCFFANANDAEAMMALLEVVQELVAERNPAAKPGTIRDSPASFRADDPW